MDAPIKKNDDITLEITGMSSDGAGIGRYEGLAVFVPFALDGETVSVHIIKVTKSYAVGKLMEIIVPSGNRAEPVCPVFKTCGGCSLMHMSYQSQLEYKCGIVKDALERIGGLKGIEVKPVIGMDDPFRYRNKGSFPFGTVDGKTVWGLYAARSHRLIETGDCVIENTASIDAADAVLRWSEKYGVAPYDETTGSGTLRHVVTRSMTGGVSVCVVTKGKLPHGNELVEELKASVIGLASVVHNVNPKNTNVICGDQFNVIWGTETVTQSISGIDFKVSAESFLQVNPIQTEKLYRLAIDGLCLQKDENAADVFCGIGTISLMLAEKTRNTVGIEYVEKAVEDARNNAKINGVDNAEFFSGAAEVVLPRLIAEGRRFDAITLDPPRKGADPAVLNAIINSGAKKVAYVSCSPATLARDLKILCDGGYRVESVQPVDMFPFTHHVESVVLMTKEYTNGNLAGRNRYG